jgi:hypothetical protein
MRPSVSEAHRYRGVLRCTFWSSPLDKAKTKQATLIVIEVELDQILC